jgi:hypothetical protein
VTQEPAVHAALGGWEDFYLIVGSAAAALTGLQFVVITLVGEGRTRATLTEGGVDAFATPTIVHFCAALFVSVTLCAPWPTMTGPALLIGAEGVVGLIYTGIVVVRARRQTAYTMVLEDWIWHVTLPLLSYATLLVSASMLAEHAVAGLFAIAAATLLFVYIGIHNAWDTSTFMVAQRLEREREAEAAAAQGVVAPPAALPPTPRAAPATTAGDGNR